MSINSALTLAYNQLTAFAGLDDFWGRFDTAELVSSDQSWKKLWRKALRK
jgi:hypothetical protein